MFAKRALLVGSLGVLGIALSAGSALGSGPAERVTVPVVGDQFVCDDATYTVTSGSIQIVEHEGESASGNENFTFTITPRKVIAEDGDGNVVSIRGATWGGGSFNVQQGTGVFTVTDKFQIVHQGSGTVDNVNSTFHITFVNGNVKEFDFGTCQTPA
jgi:hypothetical protein